MIREPVRVRLELKSRPENVTLVRTALSGLAAATQLDQRLLADLRTAVSEACNNVVLHAYEGGSGPLTVDVQGFRDGVGAIVTDAGSGINQLSSGEDRLGLGLAVITALADDSEFRTLKAGGTEVRMWFTHPAVVGADSAGIDCLSSQIRPPSQLKGEVVVWLSPVRLIKPVLAQLFGSMAASAHFSNAKAPDLRAVNEMLATYAELAADGSVGVAVSSAVRRLSMSGGPFWPGRRDGTGTSASTPAELHYLRQMLAGTADDLVTEQRGDVELLHLQLVDRSLRLV